MGGRSGRKMLPDHMDGPDPMDDPGRRQCTAKAKSTGKRCKRTPSPGGAVCKKHGGGAPQVQAKAKLRLATLTDLAIGALAALLKPAAVKKNPAQALGAAKDVLDRAGLKTPDELDITATTGTIDLEKIETLTTEELEAARTWHRKLLGRE